MYHILRPEDHVEFFPAKNLAIVREGNRSVAAKFADASPGFLTSKDKFYGLVRKAGRL